MFASAAFVAAAFSFSFCGVWLQLSKVYFVTSPPGVWFQLSKACPVVPDLLGASRAASSAMILAINDPLSLPYCHFDTGNSSAESL